MTDHHVLPESDWMSDAREVLADKLALSAGRALTGDERAAFVRGYEAGFSVLYLALDAAAEHPDEAPYLAVYAAAQALVKAWGVPVSVCLHREAPPSSTARH